MASNDERRNFLLNPEVQMEMHMQEVILNKVRLGCQIPTDAQIWSDMSVIRRDMLDYMADQVIFQFETTVFQEKLPTQTISKVVELTKPVSIATFEPVSPWQFYKERHRKGKWIGWFIRLFPAPNYKEVTHTVVARHSQKVTVDLHHSVIYPKARAIASPQMGGTAIRWVDPVWK